MTEDKKVLVVIKNVKLSELKELCEYVKEMTEKRSVVFEQKG